MNFDKYILPIYLKYFEKKNSNKEKDIEEIRELYKKMGLKALCDNDYNNAIKYFNLWQYSYAKYLSSDTYKYDFRMLQVIETLLGVDFDFDTSDIKLVDGERIRIAYLAHTLESPSAIMAKILLEVIKHHDASKFDIHVFTLESLSRVAIYPGRGFIPQFRNANCTMHYASNFDFGFNKLLSIANEINKLKPHVLVTCVALADFNHFFISALNPAPIKIGFVVGNPAQFISPSFDYGICWINRIIESCPVKCINPGVLYLPDEIQKNDIDRSSLGIPDDAFVISSAGRYLKFHDKTLLYEIVECMKEIPNLHYVIISNVNKDEILNCVGLDIRDRIHIFDWSDHYEDYLSISDIYIDTYPSGGGYTLFDSALLHIPIISFKDDISKTFDQASWNPAQDLFPEDSIILIDRDNIPNIKNEIKKLYLDTSYRLEIGERGYKSIISMKHNIRNNVKIIEGLYITLVEDKLGELNV